MVKSAIFDEFDAQSSRTSTSSLTAANFSWYGDGFAGDAIARDEKGDLQSLKRGRDLLIYCING